MIPPPPCCPLANTAIPHTHGIVLCPDLTYRNCAVAFPQGHNSKLVVMASKRDVGSLSRAVRETTNNNAEVYHHVVEEFLAHYDEKWSLCECGQN